MENAIQENREEVLCERDSTLKRIHRSMDNFCGKDGSA